MSKTRISLIILVTFTLWLCVHIPGIVYGTKDVPLHASYLTADEQSPINGALHILEARSLLGIRNEPTLYYGPIFAVIALPAVIADFSYHAITGSVTSALGYKAFIVWDWGGILVWARLIAVLAGYLALLGAFMLFRTDAFNPAQKRWVPWLAAGVICLNTLFFEYSDTFRHWIFIIAAVMWQLYLLVRIEEAAGTRRRLWIGQGVLAVFAFGLSYLGIMYQVLWIPLLVSWLRRKDWKRLREFLFYVVSVTAASALVIWWHPYGFFRTLGMAGIIAPKTSLGAVQTVTDLAGGHSFGFYAQIVIMCIGPLLIAGILLIIRDLAKKHRGDKVWARPVLWALLVPAAVNYFIFSLPAHHESRYMLPTVVLAALAILTLCSWSLSGRNDAGGVAGDDAEAKRAPADRLRIAAAVFIGIGLAWGFVRIVGWDRMIAAGPAERRIIVPQILAWQKADPSARTLVSANWPLGYAHTHAAYEDFVARYAKGDSDLWQYILASTPPAGITPLDVYYRHADEPLSAKDISQFDHAVAVIPPPIDPSVWIGSPRDQFDLKPWTVWSYQSYEESYRTLK